MSDGDIEVALLERPVAAHEPFQASTSAIAEQVDAELRENQRKLATQSYEARLAASDAKPLIEQVHETVANYATRKAEARGRAREMADLTINHVKAATVRDYVNKITPGYFPSEASSRRRDPDPRYAPIDHSAFGDAFLAIMAREIIAAQLAIRPDRKLAQLSTDQREAEIGKLVVKFRDAMQALANL